MGAHGNMGAKDAGRAGGFPAPGADVCIIITSINTSSITVIIIIIIIISSSSRVAPLPRLLLDGRLRQLLARDGAAEFEGLLLALQLQLAAHLRAFLEEAVVALDQLFYLPAACVGASGTGCAMARRACASVGGRQDGG